MAMTTRDALLAWVVSEQPGHGPVLERLAVYRSRAVMDDAVPAGWIRLLVSQSSHSVAP